MKKICTLILTCYAMLVFTPLASACEGHNHQKAAEQQQEEVKVEEVQVDSESK
jgi:hypothetical protein